MDSVYAVQRRFLRELQISEKDALLNFGAAPLQTPRDTAMLGPLRNITLGTSRPRFSTLFSSGLLGAQELHPGTAAET